MKFLTLALTVLISSSAFASISGATKTFSGAITGASAVPGLLSSSTTYGCVTGNLPLEGNELSTSEQVYNCLLSTAVLASTALVLKEEVQQVEADAYAFLAGEEMTLALEEVISKARSEVAELQEQSDETIISALLAL